MTALKAYIATDDEESTIVFGTRNDWSLRSDAAGDMSHGDANEIVSVRRAPEFDEFADGRPITIADKLARGWWQECRGCQRRVSEDMDDLSDDEDDGREFEPSYHLFWPNSVWCSAVCRDADILAHQERRAREAAQYASASDAALARWPGITICSVGERPHHKQPNAAVVHFRFPSQENPYSTASWEVGNTNVSIPRAEVDAWFLYLAALQNAQDRDPGDEARHQIFKQGVTA